MSALPAEDEHPLTRQIPLVASHHRLVRCDIGIERVETLGAAYAALGVTAGGDKVAPAGHVRGLSRHPTPPAR
jgi:hypothetical protein